MRNGQDAARLPHREGAAGAACRRRRALQARGPRCTAAACQRTTSKALRQLCDSDLEVAPPPTGTNRHQRNRCSPTSVVLAGSGSWPPEIRETNLGTRCNKREMGRTGGNMGCTAAPCTAQICIRVPGTRFASKLEDGGPSKLVCGDPGVAGRGCLPREGARSALLDHLGTHNTLCDTSPSSGTRPFSGTHYSRSCEHHLPPVSFTRGACRTDGLVRKCAVQELPPPLLLQAAARSLAIPPHPHRLA